MHLSPAEYVIFIFNGVRATARALGVSPSAVSKWRKPDSNGVIGIIPARAHIKILEAAEHQGLDLTPHDLIYGRTIERAG